jgi:hypothetical protein
MTRVSITLYVLYKVVAVFTGQGTVVVGAENDTTIEGEWAIKLLSGPPEAVYIREAGLRS